MKSKKQRQEWWNNLTPDERKDYLDKRLTLKAEKRRKKSIELMKNYKGFNCKACIHKLSGSCTDNLKNGCEYFCDPFTMHRYIPLPSSNVSGEKE